MISKFITVSFFVAVATAASVISPAEKSNELVFNYGDLTHKSSINARYHVLIGNRINGDFLQFEESIQGDNGLKVKFNVHPHRRITAIIIVDLNENGNGDYPVPIDGGVDKNFVTLQFFSTSEKPVNFYVSIYGL